MPGQKFVLVVEDNDMLRPLLETSMLSFGHRVIAVASHREAVDALSVHHGELDALITDQQLDEASGVDLARSALRNMPEVRVMIITGDDLSVPDDIRGQVSVLQKPFSVQKLNSWLAEPNAA